jgi:MFS family permease
MRARSNYYLILAAALLYGTAAGQLTMLAPMLKQMTVASAAIGLMLAAVPLGNIAGRIWSAWVVEKLGIRRALYISASTAALGIAILIPAISAPILVISLVTASAAVIRGVSYSIFNTAGICAVRARSAPGQHVYAMGLFTSMFMAANLWAPSIGEYTLTHFGPITFFACATLPMLLAVILGACTIDILASSPTKPTRYLALLGDGRMDAQDLPERRCSCCRPHQYRPWARSGRIDTNRRGVAAHWFLQNDHTLMYTFLMTLAPVLGYLGKRSLAKPDSDRRCTAS